jgi:hypothetical protein
VNFSLIRTEITTDPKSRGYAGKTPEEQATLINAIYDSILVPISCRQFLTWLVSVGGLKRLEAIANTSPLYDAARGALIVASYPPLEQFNLADSTIQAQVEAFKQGGIFTESEIDSLYAIGTKSVSRADELGLGRIWPGDISAAMQE